MKRILALILVLLLSLTVMVGCDKVPGLQGVVDKATDLAGKIPFIGDLINKGDETPTDDIKYDVNAAKEFITQMYKDANPETKRNYDVAAQCLIEGVRYEITWTIEGTDVVTVQASSTNGFWTIVVPEKNEAAVNYKITATIKAGDGTTATVSFDRVIPVVDNQGIVTDLKEGVAYKFFLDQNDAKVAQTLFAIGSTQNNENKFILTTTDPKQAPDFFAEKVEGGYKFYTMIDGVKNYVHCKTTVAEDGKVSKYIGFATESNSVYTYEAETNAWFTTIDGAKYVVGTYGTYKTICISEAKYISADNTGISQFPVSFMTSAYAETLAPDEEVEYKVPTLENAVAPVAGTAYNLGMIQGNKDNGVYYLTGSLSGYYMATTDAVASAVNFYVEAVEGGYNLYAIVAGEKLYVNFVVSGTHVNGKYEATATTVYTYDATLKTFKTTVNDTAYILGTTASNTYTTVGPVKATELNFYMQFVVSTNADQEGTTPDTPVDPNPDTPVAGTVTLNKENLFPGITSTSYADYNGTHTVNGITVETNSVLGNVHGVDVLQFKKAEGTLTVKNVTATSITVVVVSSYDSPYWPTISIAGTALTTPDNATILATKTATDTKNANGYDVYAYTITITLASAVTGDIVVANAANGAIYMSSISYVGTSTTTQPGEGEGNEGGNTTPSEPTIQEVTVTEAAALADGTKVIITATVSKITYAWSDTNKNMSVDLTDGTTTLNAYKLATKVGAGDVIKITGTVSSFNGNKQIAEGATAEIVTAHTTHTYVDGKCSACGAVQPTKTYTKATSVAVGDTIALVCDTKSVELSSISNTSTIYGIGTEYTDGIVGLYTLTIVAGSKEGTVAFLTADGKYLTWTSGNSLKTADSISDNASWTITFDNDGNAIIKNAADNARQLQFNASNPRFATYTSTQTAVQIYKEA